MTYIFHPRFDLWTYELSHLTPQSEYRIVEINAYCSKIQKVLRRLLPNWVIWCPLYFNKEFRQILKSITPGDTLILAEYLNPKIVQLLSKTNTKAKKFWLWNIVRNTGSDSFIDEIKEKGFQIATFDEEDAAYFSIDFHNQFYPMYTDYQQEECKYDFFFIGYDKEREKELLDIEKLLKEKGYRTKFIIVHSPSERIPYSHCVELIKQSRCIVEYIQKGQKGITIRPLEAISFGKKLLTNTEDANVLALFDDSQCLSYNSISDVDSFMSKSISAYKDSLKERFDVNTWIRSLKEMDNE